MNAVTENVLQWGVSPEDNDRRIAIGLVVLNVFDNLMVSFENLQNTTSVSRRSLTRSSVKSGRSSTEEDYSSVSGYFWSSFRISNWKQTGEVEFGRSLQILLEGSLFNQLPVDIQTKMQFKITRVNFNSSDDNLTLDYKIIGPQYLSPRIMAEVDVWISNAKMLLTNYSLQAGGNAYHIFTNLNFTQVGIPKFNQFNPAETIEDLFSSVSIAVSSLGVGEQVANTSVTAAFHTIHINASISAYNCYHADFAHSQIHSPSASIKVEYPSSIVKKCGSKTLIIVYDSPAFFFP